MDDAVSTARTDWAPGRVTVAGALREAVVSMLAALATLGCTLTIAKGSGPAVLAVVLSVSLSRSHLDRDWRQRLESTAALPVVGLAALGVGLLLLYRPWLGAIVFVAGLFVSIWLRRFGATAQRLGSLIALPFVALLVAPPIVMTQAGPVPAPLLPILIALLALLWVGVLHALARRTGSLPPPKPAPRPLAKPQERAGTTRESGLCPIASTRMAVQMTVALAASFVVGFAFFGDRWAWIVLTAFIVNSGNRGRLDVAYKSVLRVVGAAAGTVAALLVSRYLGGNGFGTAVLILTAVFLGVWLRPLGYAWWALFVTVALALLQGFGDLPVAQLLALRLEEIVIGALLGVASAWWVLPVRSISVLRRRLADALAALSAALDPATPERTATAFLAAVAGVEQLAPAFRAVCRVTRRLRRLQPADWIDVLLACRNPAAALIENGETPADVRRSISAARKALREPSTLLPALQNLQRALAG